MITNTKNYEDKPIILLGFMGVGKTSIGKKLAKALGLEFLDTDKFIEKKEGMTIPQIFEQHGEAYFRQCEFNVLNDIEKLKNIVISVGGGLPCFNNNMEKLNQIGFTVYLKKDPISLANHLKSIRQNRPLILELDDDDLLNFVQIKLDEREKFYVQANFTILVNRSTLDGLLDQFGKRNLNNKMI